MTKEEFLSVADQYFRKANPGGNKWTLRKIFYGPFIADKKLNTARQAYASFNLREETPVLLYDDTLFGNGKSGFLITNRHFYYSISAEYAGTDTVGYLELSAIHSFAIQMNKMSADVIVNGKKLGTITQISREEALIVEDFFALIPDEELVSGALQTAASHASPVAGSDSRTEIMVKIKQLKELLDLEAITQEEFDAKKKEWLAQL